MKATSISQIGLIGLMSLFMACSSTSNREVSRAPKSDDLLELLTGFGESLSKRNFLKAVDYMVPEEKALMTENGVVPADKQKMLLALPLQRLIRHPGVRVENGHIAGIYAVLPDLRHGETSSMAAAGNDSEMPDAPAPREDVSVSESSGPMHELASTRTGYEDMVSTSVAVENDPRLKDAVTKFFSAVNNRNWNSALAMMNEDERKLLLDDKGKLKESSKQRLSQMDQKNRTALVMQDGKLTGVTLLLPSN